MGINAAKTCRSQFPFFAIINASKNFYCESLGAIYPVVKQKFKTQALGHTFKQTYVQTDRQPRAILQASHFVEEQKVMMNFLLFKIKWIQT